jgi:hypothetical protein
MFKTPWQLECSVRFSLETTITTPTIFRNFSTINPSAGRRRT